MGFSVCNTCDQFFIFYLNLESRLLLLLCLFVFWVTVSSVAILKKLKMKISSAYYVVYQLIALYYIYWINAFKSRFLTCFQKIKLNIFC